MWTIYNVVILNSVFDGMKYGLECGMKLILAAPDRFLFVVVKAEKKTDNTRLVHIPHTNHDFHCNTAGYPMCGIVLIWRRPSQTLPVTQVAIGTVKVVVSW